MTLWEAILLGVLQGATEFLPISSSGHLALAELALDLHPGLAFNAALHAGTLVVVIGYYRRALADMIRGLWRAAGALRQGCRFHEIWGEQHGARLALLLVLGSVPTAVIGLLLESRVERYLKSGAFTSAALVVTGLLLLATRLRPAPRVASEDPHPGVDPLSQGVPTLITPTVAFVIGVAQGLAVLPGISRSGATLATALLLGVGRLDAARFAFLLSVPAILGALLLSARSLVALGRLDPVSLAAGVGASMVVGCLCLALLVRLVRRGAIHHFAWYVIPLGVIGFLLF